MSRARTRITSAGPDAVHLCLTVRGRPHVWGCAWASYGEARPRAPFSRGRLVAAGRVGRARPLQPPPEPPPSDPGPTSPSSP